MYVSCLNEPLCVASNNPTKSYTVAKFIILLNLLYCSTHRPVRTKSNMKKKKAEKELIGRLPQNAEKWKVATMHRQDLLTIIIV